MLLFFSVNLLKASLPSVNGSGLICGNIVVLDLCQRTVFLVVCWITFIRGLWDTKSLTQQLLQYLVSVQTSESASFTEFQTKLYSKTGSKIHRSGLPEPGYSLGRHQHSGAWVLLAGMNAVILSSCPRLLCHSTVQMNSDPAALALMIHRSQFRRYSEIHNMITMDKPYLL